MHGGVNWAGGATIYDMPVWRSQRPAQLNSNLPRIMAEGGMASPLSERRGAGGEAEEQTELMRKNNKLLQTQIEEMKNWKTKIKGEWVIKDLDETRQKYDQAKKVSGLNQ